jgi:(p)ppGpp synthase/HD superfamily hydrolase
MLELCKQIALKAHEGQMYGDKPYSYHLEQVVNQMNDHETDAKMVAWLHDIIEDGHVSGKQLTELGVPEHVVEAVGLLTKMHGETYVQYINNICTNRLAMRVKEADLVANIANGPCKSLRERYIKALAVILTAEVNVMTYRG